MSNWSRPCSGFAARPPSVCRLLLLRPKLRPSPMGSSLCGPRHPRRLGSMRGDAVGLPRCGQAQGLPEELMECFRPSVFGKYVLALMKQTFCVWKRPGKFVCVTKGAVEAKSAVPACHGGGERYNPQQGLYATAEMEIQQRRSIQALLGQHGLLEVFALFCIRFISCLSQRIEGILCI